jgi:uncharacterized protein (DUF2147 family)
MNDPVKWLAGVAAVLLAVTLSAHPAPAAGAADPTFGDWLTDGGGGKVRVGPCAANPALACGVLVWFKPPADVPAGPPHDANNPDPALRGRPILGLPIISDFRRDSPGHWVDGKIYDPNSGRTYRSKMSIGPDGALKVAGCVLVFCQAQTWTRAAAS